VLDELMAIFSGSTFSVWMRIWIAAAEDEELRRIITPIELRVSQSLAEVMHAVAPAEVDGRTWSRRTGVMLDTLRGVALSEMFAPIRGRELKRWPSTRKELLRLLLN